MRLLLGITAILMCSWLMPSSAFAHPLLESAVEAYEEADFETALRTFDTAARNADLSVEELLKLFEMRALVQHALGDEGAMNQDLERLVAVRTSYQLSRLAPPSVREAFARIAAERSGDKSVELRIEEKSIEGQPWMFARLLRVPDGLVDHTTLQCNIDAGARTTSRTSQGISTSLKLPESGLHQGCAATARTRQGGILFSANLDGQPLPFPSGTSGRFDMPSYKSRDQGAKPKKKRWPWIVAVSAVAVAGAVTAGVLVSQRSGNSDPQSGAVTVNW